MQRSHWRMAPERKDEARRLHDSHGLHPVIAHLLLNRGLAAADFAGFLDPNADICGDHALLTDLDRAADRLALAVRERQKVVIYGDYDADGCCAGAVLSRFLQRFDVPYTYYVPDRFEEGYGVNAAALLRLVTGERPALIVTVDCGIGSAEEIDTVVALGTDVIVTDHHQVPERVPAVPAVNPHRAECEYPFQDLCGAAVIFKVCQATLELLGVDDPALEEALLELVMIGTIADVMPLVGENRWFARRGLELLARTRSTGLRALLETAGLGRTGALSARDIGFGVGPRLNAAGRLESARMSYRLLITDDNAEAYELAERLESLNRDRREIEARTTDEAMAQIDEAMLAETWGLIVAGDGWHEGVVGLVASRVCRQHCRPALAIAMNGAGAKGSGRSTAAVDLHAALTVCGDLFDKFGGHPRAAGFSLPKDNIEPLRERFNEAVKQQITADDLVPQIELECALKASALTLELAREMERLCPHGEGNPEPVLEVRGLRIGEAKATRDGTHLQLTFVVDPGRGESELKGFWPRMGRVADRLHRGAEAIVAGSLGIDRWQGRERPQLTVSDLKLMASRR